METLDYNQLLLVSLWQYNHHGDEGLTPALFEETFGKVYGSHYYEKWTGYFNRNLWDMIAYFRSEKENGQKFCDMVARQVKLYQQKRSQYDNTSLNFMLHQQRIQIFHSLSHDLIACSGYSRTRQ